MPLGLSDYQYFYGPHLDLQAGLLLGDLTPYDVKELEGLEGFDARVGDVELPRGHGSQPGKHFQSARLVRVVCEFVGDETYVEGLSQTLHDAFQVSEDWDHHLVWKHPGRPERFIRCRPVDVTYQLTAVSTRLRPFVVTLRAANPRLYGTDLVTTSVPIYAATISGGDYPGDYPKDLTLAAGALQEAIVTNSGKANAYPLVRFYGPAVGTVTRVKLTNLTNGVILDINTALLTGQILTANMEAFVTGANTRVIDLSGATRYADWQLPRVAFRLAPGDNTLRYEVTGTSTSTYCTVTHRNTWNS